MIALPRQITCQKIMDVAREQAWSSPRQVLGLPTRLGDEPEFTRHWDLTAIAEVLDQATVLQWGPDELTVWDRNDVAHHFAIRQPGRSWTTTCAAPSPDCARLQDSGLTRDDAEALASDHDGLHHDGVMAAEVTSTSELAR